MSQIICYKCEKIDWSQNWSVAYVENIELLKKYMRRDSIVVVGSNSVFESEKLSLFLLRLAFPDSKMIILGDGESNSVIYYSSYVEINELVFRIRKSYFSIPNRINIYEESLKLLQII